MIPTRSLIGAQSEVLENEIQVEDLMVDLVDPTVDQGDLMVDLMEDNFKEVECLGSIWMGTWEAQSGVKYLDKMSEWVKHCLQLLLKRVQY